MGRTQDQGQDDGERSKPRRESIHERPRGLCVVRRSKVGNSIHGINNGKRTSPFRPVSRHSPERVLVCRLSISSGHPSVQTDRGARHSTTPQAPSQVSLTDEERTNHSSRVGSPNLSSPREGSKRVDGGFILGPYFLGTRLYLRCH